VPALKLGQVGQLAIDSSGDLNWVDPLVGVRVRQLLASDAHERTATRHQPQIDAKAHSTTLDHEVSADELILGQALIKGRM
jgi:hypothetical protein